jgi:hypothetical protein
LATQTTAKRAPKQPQDRKPKQSTDFALEVNGKEYTLPRINQDMINTIEGRIVEAALLDGEEGQAKMAFALLRAVPGHDEAKEAIRSLPFPEMLGKLIAWLEAGGSPLGESQG